MADEQHNEAEEGVIELKLADDWEQKVEEKLSSDIRAIEEDDWPLGWSTWTPGNYKILFVGGQNPVTKNVERWSFDTDGRPLWAHIGGAVFNPVTMISIEKEK